MSCLQKFDLRLLWTGLPLLTGFLLGDGSKSDSLLTSCSELSLNFLLQFWDLMKVEKVVTHKKIIPN